MQNAVKRICRRCAASIRPHEPCRDCGKSREVADRDERGPQCRYCRSRDRSRPCARCGTTAVIVARGPDGPLCTRCRRQDRFPQHPCRDCGLRTAEVTAVEDGIPRCASCYGKLRVSCSRCGTIARADRRWPEGPVCRACVDQVLASPAICSRCQQPSIAFQHHDGDPVCPECAGVRFSYRCRTCRGFARLESDACCRACTAQSRLTALTTDPVTGAAPEWLLPLVDELAAYENPSSLDAYLRGPGGQLISQLATGALLPTHEALDELRQTASVNHLRDVLILVGILPPRDEQLAQLARDVTVYATALDPGNRLILTRYGRWSLMPLAQHAIRHGKPLTKGQRAYLLRRLRVARQFLSHLHYRGVLLADCTQARCDRWVTQHCHYQAELRHFLVWSADARLSPPRIAIAAAQRAENRSIMSDTERVLTALRLETDETVPLADRVAGCLVLQYGQLCTRIVSLTMDDVQHHPNEPDTLGLLFGRDPLWLRPRLSALLQRLIDSRTPPTVIARSHPTPYLFPGMRPGRHLTANALSERLVRHGIPATRLARNGAWLSLVSSVHWKMLADLIGTCNATAHRWHLHSATDRASYVAMRLKDQPPPSAPE